MVLPLSVTLFSLNKLSIYSFFEIIGDGKHNVFSTYPMNIFNGIVRIFLFTIVPAGFISFVPLQLLQHFSIPLFAGMIGFTLLFACIAIGLFELGLRRYESGNLLGMQN
jgi:ABC-2 type transport system permease protein